MQRITISSKAADLIRTECRRHPTTETGGILVAATGYGHRPAYFHIIDATGPGPKAVHSPGGFIPDIDYCNTQLQALQKPAPSLTYCGTWHKHPGAMSAPSGPDLAQAQQIVNDPDYGLDTVIVIIATGEAPTLRGFVLQRGAPAFQEAHIEISEQQAAPTGHPTLSTEIDMLKQGGWTVEQRKTAAGLQIINVGRAGGTTALSFVVPADSTARPEILAQTRLPWPPGVDHLAAAVASILGDDACLQAQHVARLLQALSDRGLAAQPLWFANGAGGFALARPGKPASGFLVLPGFPGEARLYDALGHACDVPMDPNHAIWANQVHRALTRPSKNRWLPFVIVVLLALLIALCVAVDMATGSGAMHQVVRFMRDVLLWVKGK